MHNCGHKCGGLTLVEMMVALAAGLIVVAAAGAMVRQARHAYQQQSERSQLHDAARQGLGHLALALAHAGYQQDPSQPRRAVAVRGSRGGPGNGDKADSDQFTITLHGDPDENIRNCAGTKLPVTPASQSRYFISTTAGPGLRCQHHAGTKDPAMDELIPDATELHLSYGVDTDGDGHADRWLDSAAMSDQLWPRVRLVRIGLTLQARPQPMTFHTTVWLRNAQASTAPR